MAERISKPLVGIIMGSTSDWNTMQVATSVLDEFAVPYECRALSAHRSPDLVAEYAKSAVDRGLEVIIAAAGMAAALPGVVAAMTPLPVLGVPMESKLMGGLDSLLSMSQMPGGVPVGTLAIGSAGAKNAALLSVRILANSRPELRSHLVQFYAEMAQKVGQESEL